MCPPINTRADAHWQFNGSGFVAQAVPFRWESDEDTGVFVPDAWSPITDGSEPAILGGTLANDAAKSQTFH
jgi:hypothetical protein